METVKIVVDDGTTFTAHLDTLPRVGDKVYINKDILGGVEKSYVVTQVNFHLRGPLDLSISSIDLQVRAEDSH